MSLLTKVRVIVTGLALLVLGLLLCFGLDFRSVKTKESENREVVDQALPSDTNKPSQ